MRKLGACKSLLIVRLCSFKMFTITKTCCKRLLTGIGASQKKFLNTNSCIRLSSAVKHIKVGETAHDSHQHPLTNRFLGLDTSGTNDKDGKTCFKDTNSFGRDPDEFGTLSNSVKSANEEEYDDGDILEKEHLENVPDPSQKLHTEKYAKMIKRHLKNKNLKDAIGILETRMLRQDRVKPEAYIYNLLISGCGQLGETKQAFHLYNNMKKRGLKVKGSVYTSLFNACATSFYPQDALKLANRLRQIMIEKNYQPNAINYHAMIKAYGRCGDLTTAFSLVDEMVEKKIAVSGDTINFLLQACISDHNAGFRHALLVWRKMRDHRIKPSIHTYNLILRACKDCGLGEPHLTTEILNKITNTSAQVFMIESTRKTSEHNDTALGMNAAKVSTNSILYSDNLDESETVKEKSWHFDQVTTNKDEECEEFLPQLVEGKIDHSGSSLMMQGSTQNCWPNLLAVEPRLGYVTSINELKLAKDRLMLLGGSSEFLKQMECDKVEPCIKTFTQLLDLIPPTRAAEKELMKTMKQGRVKPDINFYNMLIKKRAMERDFESSREVMSMIKQARLQPDLITYGVLAYGCKNVDEAMELLDEVTQAGLRVNAEILGALLNKAAWHWNFGYVIKMMDVAKKEEVELNSMFYKHLDTFYNKCRQLLHDKKLGRPVPKFVESHYFQSGFKLFKTCYTNWLKNTQTEPPDLKGR